MSIDTDSKYLLKVRFIGENLDQRSIPIYELGTSLVAVQRLINKAYLERRGYHKGRNQLSHKERRELSLQVTSRRKESDAYVLNSFLSVHPVLTSVLETVIGTSISQTLGALRVYARQHVHLLGRRQAEVRTNDEHRSRPDVPFELIANIYNEISALSERINDVSGVSTIEVSTDSLPIPTIVVNESFRDYVRGLVGEEFEGPETTLVGQLESLNIRKQTVDVLRVEEYGKVSVHLDDYDFDMVRHNQETEDIFVFTGHYIITMGTSTHGKLKFRARSVQRV